MAESYESLIFKLGDIAYERLWNKPNAPPVMGKVLQAAQAFEERQIELEQTERAMDEEEKAFQEFVQAAEQELEGCRETVARYKRTVEIIEAKAKPIESQLGKMRRDHQAASDGCARLEQRLLQLQESREEAKAADTKAMLKRARIDLMRTQRRMEELEREEQALLHPTTSPDAEAMEARLREKDLEAQLQEREASYQQMLKDLGERAAEGDQAIRAAKDYFDKALCALGQAVFQARLADPALAAFYPKLEKFRR